MLIHPCSHIILTPGQPVMFRGPSFIVSTMQAGTTHIFNVFGMTGPSSNQESNPQILLVSAGSPLSSPFTISRGYLVSIRHQGAPSGAPIPDPHGAPFKEWKVFVPFLYMDKTSSYCIKSTTNLLVTPLQHG